MIKDKIGEKLVYKNVEYTIGEPIIGTEESEYQGLFGMITEIRTGEDQETENEGPDIYCSFEEPVLPHEKKALEKIFSELYGYPKKLEEIVLDRVIMAPHMIRQIQKSGAQTAVPVFVVCTEWKVDAEEGNAAEVFSNIDEARYCFHNNLVREKSEGMIAKWSKDEDFTFESGKDCCNCYILGEYQENHYRSWIEKRKMLLLNAVREKSN